MANKNNTRPIHSVPSYSSISLLDSPKGEGVSMPWGMYTFWSIICFSSSMTFIRDLRASDLHQPHLRPRFMCASSFHLLWAIYLCHPSRTTIGNSPNFRMSQGNSPTKTFEWSLSLHTLLQHIFSLLGWRYSLLHTSDAIHAYRDPKYRGARAISRLWLFGLWWKKCIGLLCLLAFLATRTMMIDIKGKPWYKVEPAAITFIEKPKPRGIGRFWMTLRQPLLLIVFHLHLVVLIHHYSHEFCFTEER